MFEIVLDDAKFWRGCIDAIVNLIDEGVLEVKPDGMYLKAMDPSQIAMVCFFVPKTSFVTYNVDDDMKLGLNFDNLSKILARSREKENLKMFIEDNSLVMEFMGRTMRRFKVPLLDLSAGPQREPKVEYDAMVKLLGGQFKEILRDASLISSHLVIEVNEEGLFVDAKGDSADMKVKSDKASVDELKIKKPAKAAFPLQFLEDIVKACPSDSSLTLHLKTDAPIKVEYNVGDANLTYYLAPRLQE